MYLKYSEPLLFGNLKFRGNTVFYCAVRVQLKLDDITVYISWAKGSQMRLNLYGY